MNVVLDDHADERPLKEVADAIVTPVGISRELPFPGAHEVGDVRVRCGHDGMEVSAHWAKGQDFDAVLFLCVDEQAIESLAVAIVFENPGFSIASVHDVIRGAGNVWSRRS